MTKFLYASTKNADMFYALRIRVGDPVFLLDIDGQKIVFLDKREFGMFTEENQNELLSARPLEPVIEKARENKESVSGQAKIAYALLEETHLLKSVIHVPSSFPLDIADYLRLRNVQLSVEDEIYPERQIKTEEEVEAIRSAIDRTKKAFEWVEEVLRVSTIEGDSVVYRKEPLTSEFLRKVVDRMLFDEGLSNVEGSIISCGRHSAEPHHPGKGFILPHQSIVVDLFPQDKETGYFADMTRTYLKGTPSLELKRMFDAVKTAKEAAIVKIKAGVSAKSIHETCVRIFTELGFETGEKGGFIHSTGHGVGLEIHEKPNLGLRDEPLQVGNVVTVEPGLYYPEHGGVRIEDVVVVTERGSLNLTSHPVEFLIP